MSKTVNFSYLPTKIALVSSAIAACSLMVTIVVFGINPNQATTTQFGATEYPASLGSLASGCGDLYLFNPDPSQYGIIPEEVKANEGVVNIPVHLNSTIPVYGYMSAEPLGASQIRFYTKDELKEPISREQILRTMYENDTTVVWYTDDIAPDDYQVLKEYVDSHENILATKWEYPSLVIPQDRKIAFSTWGMSQTCEYWTDINFEKFQEFKKEHKIPKASTIPEAKLNDNGLLPEITKTTGPAR